MHADGRLTNSGALFDCAAAAVSAAVTLSSRSLRPYREAHYCHPNAALDVLTCTVCARAVYIHLLTLHEYTASPSSPVSPVTD